MLHELKQQVIDWCQPILEFCQNLGEPGLFILSFIESSFFPIPPDFLYIPMVLGGANNPYMLATVASVGSTLGAVFGYALGKFGGKPIAVKLLGSHGQNLIEKAEGFFKQYGSAAVLIAAFTPIPFKVFTVSAGISSMPLLSFTLYSAVGRSARFFTVIYLLVNFGEVIMQNFFELSLVAVLVLAAGFGVYRWLQRSV